MSHRSAAGRIRLLPLIVLALISAAPVPRTNRLPVENIGGRAFISIYDIATLPGIDSSFDTLSQKGKLYNKEHRTVYAVGLSVFLVDGGLYKTTYPVVRRKGEVFIPRDAAEEMLRALVPGSTMRRGASETLLTRADDDGLPPERDAMVPKRDRIGFIVIDPGHGGKDPGAISKGGRPEKDMALKIAKIVAAELASRHKGVDIRLTRSGDRFIELAGRTEIANAMLKKDVNGIFVSIHVNSAPTPKISGVETYFLSQNPSNEEARKTAAFENCVILLEEGGGEGAKRDDVDYIEAIMLTTQIQRESELLANTIQDAVISNNKGVKSRGVRKADFYVLRGVLMPAALVETGFITNKAEARLLQTDEHQRRIAKGIALGIDKFIKKYNKMVKGPR